ncbi:MAG: LpqB family beta-propeller domain-containing protein [Actinomycetota bacterium]|nr:LpqB family beta-propeller domain-containing protein [Actinomycetota bacterium]
MIRVRRAWAGLVAVAVLAAGCSAIPVAGEVQEGDNNVGEPGQIIPQGSLPGLDATPEEILRGFLAASPAGVNSAHQITREYLTLGGRTSWEPWRSVTVYRADPRFEIVSATTGRVTYSVTMPVAASVDEQGLLTETSGLTEQSFEFELARSADAQWRIDSLPDAVLLNVSNFNNLFRATTLYFPTPDRRMLVPDVRWFVREGAATLAVRALLESGPAPWLRDAVLSGVLDGARLEGESVIVDVTGTATVDLGPTFMDLPREDQSLVLAQLETMLVKGGVSGASAVRFLVQGVPITVPVEDSLIRDPAPDGNLVALGEDGSLVSLTATGLVPVEGVAPLEGITARSPAQGIGGFPLVLLSGSRRLVNVRAEAVSEPWVEGRRLVDPSVDLFGWVWTTPEVSDGTLVAARSVVEQVGVQAEWLEGREVRSLRVSRDGARIVIVSTGTEGTTVDVAGVTRDELGRPQRVGASYTVGAVLADATEAHWVDESTLAVLGATTGAVSQSLALVSVGGFTSTRGTPGGGSPVVALATGKGDRAIYAATEDGTLWQWRTGSWEKVASGVRDPAFPG